MLIKPDGMLNGGIDEAVSKISNSGLTIRGFQRIALNVKTVEELYPKRTKSPFGKENIDYMTSGECGLVSVEGEDAVKTMLRIKGKTYTSGLRLSYANNFVHNTFHCPDTPDDCEQELGLLSKLK